MYEIRILDDNRATIRDTNIDCYLVVTNIGVLPASEVQVINDKPYSSLQDLKFVVDNVLYCGTCILDDGNHVQVYISNVYNPVFAVAKKLNAKYLL